MSFAYKKGIPDDPTGNGGGYVFDCRAVNNPGKYERYKPFTGLDEPVIRFLEEDGEIFPFLEHAYALVDASVKRYMERGFSNLSLRNKGCKSSICEIYTLFYTQECKIGCFCIF